MRKRLLGMVMFAAIASMAAGRPTAAQMSKDAGLVKIPFRFIVGEKLLPAGTYQIWSESSDWEMMKIAPLGTKSPAATARTRPSPNPRQGGTKVRVQFKNVHGHYFLQWVQMPFGDVHEVIVTPAQAERTLTRLNLMPAEPAGVTK